MHMDAITSAVSALAASMTDQLGMTTAVFLEAGQPTIGPPVGPQIEPENGEEYAHKQQFRHGWRLEADAESLPRVGHVPQQ